MRIARVALLGVVLAGCKSQPPADSPPEPSGPAVKTPGPAEPPPKAERSPPRAACDVVFAVDVGSGNAVTVTARNDSDAEVSFELPDRCPAGPLRFEGLGDGYDYYGACAMGACAGPRAPKTVRLAAGQAQVIARTTIHTGATSCNGPLPAGRYTLGVAAPETGARACVETAVFEVGVPPREKKTTRAPAKKTPPKKKTPKQTSAKVDFHACQSDADCIIYCPDTPGCCGNPCGCKTAINRAHKDAFERAAAASCLKPPHCPAMGCARQDAHSARCHEGRCVPASIGYGF